MRRFLLLILLITVSLSIESQTQKIKKSKLKILYVAQNPQLPDGYMFGGDVKLWKSLEKTRPQDFYQFFKRYFKKVTMIYGEKYKEAMSKKYDVTIFDALIPQLDGKKLKYWNMHEAPDYLSKNYDAATIFIAGPAGPLLWNKKTKIDWLCNCLGSYAFSIKEDHPIFNTPYKVILPKVIRKNNPGVFRYYSGKDIPEKIPMWQVQKVSKGYPPGIVSSPGFGDSPDAEVISGGTCIKSIKAVALGRHGNFFQWGYRASPRYLTKSARLALINTIHYIARFKGQKPFVKRIAPHRLEALDDMYKVSDKGYAGIVKSMQQMNGYVNVARVRKLVGESKPFDKYLLKGDNSFPDRTYFLGDVPKSIVKKYMADWNGYLQYYEKNKGYLGLSKPKEIYGTTYYDIIIDKDVQQLGIANNDIKLLEKCINMLLSNTQPALAQRLLERYTTEKFTTAKQWEKWLQKNKSKLFFTETGGYKFLLKKD